MSESGSSHSLSTGNTLANMNPRWLAPELLEGGKATRASDIYAYGVVLWGEAVGAGLH